MRAPGSILLLSSYELGHPPHALAMMAGFLERAGFRPTLLDLAKDPLRAESAAKAKLIVFSTPMHTALRLGLAAWAELRQAAPRARVAFAGLYAALNRELLIDGGADWVLAGEFEGQLVAIAEALEAGDKLPIPTPSRRRQAVPAPSRRGIEDLSRYARFIDADGNEHLAGYAETTRGCLESCRHCPVPAVYGGRFVAIDAEVVLADIAAQVARGAEHITFGDPDFLNGPTHALRICRELHRRWPQLTFDFTAQVANLLEHRETTSELARLGCAFVVTAVESLSDEVLENLGKRHRAKDVASLLTWADSIGLNVRPTLVPFTPWTKLPDIAALCDWVAERGLQENVAPVQMSVRLLVPPRSLLLEYAPERFGPMEPSALGHSWQNDDPRVDELAADVAELTAAFADEGESDGTAHAAIRDLARGACSLPPIATEARPRRRVPRVSEPWFC